MKVKELIKELKKLNQNDLVVLSADEEGNGYLPLGGIQDGMAYLDAEVHIKKLTPDLEEQGFTEEDVASKDAKSCIVLYP
jgi:hypothetical protein